MANNFICRKSTPYLCLAHISLIALSHRYTLDIDGHELKTILAKTPKLPSLHISLQAKEDIRSSIAIQRPMAVSSNES